ncbi:MAG: hypothetical protein AAFX04_13265 [Pseudomonadota bacterium]
MRNPYFIFDLSCGFFAKSPGSAFGVVYAPESSATCQMGKCNVGKIVLYLFFSLRKEDEGDNYKPTAEETPPMARSTEEQDNSNTEAAASPKRPIVEIDFAKYLEFTKDFDATEEEQRELIATLHKIMLTFVDMGFDLCPVQHVDVTQHSCESFEEDNQDAAQSLQEVIRSLVASETSLTTAFDTQSKGTTP